MRIVQLIPTVVTGDAVGNDAICMHRCLQQFDRNTHIYAEQFAPELSEFVSDVSKLPALGEEDVLIYHMSIGSPASLRIDELPCRKVMVYHNITPPEYFAPYSRLFHFYCTTGRTELRRMCDWFDYCIADSEFNRQDLIREGYTCPIDVCPVMVPLDDYGLDPDPRLMRKYSDGRTNVVFVGRIAPNKRQENVIRAFAAYQSRFDPEARLLLVGSIGAMKSYADRLRRYARAIGARHVNLTDHVPFRSILAYYRTASVFLCLSEHEGFCVPVLESMYFDVPVVALAAAAVPETQAGSGISLKENDPEQFAEAIHRVVTDDAYRAEILRGQRKRLRELNVESVQLRFAELLSAFLAAPRAKKKPRILQMLPSLSRGDAVGEDALAIDRALSALPARRDIWTLRCDDELLCASVRCSDRAPFLSPDDIAVFHMAMGEPMADRFAALPCRKVLLYHSITPAEFTDTMNPAMADACRRGLRQTEKLLGRVERAFGCSPYDARELESLGGQNIGVLPLVIDWSRYDAADEDGAARYRDGAHNILFIGRMAPNKRIENVIRAFACYRERFDPEARLLLAGSDRDFGSYGVRLRSYASQLAGENVRFLGKVSFPMLLGLYRSAHAYLSMSEHEGFGVPLLEAMYFDVPVVALGAAAVPETLGGAGILLSSLDPEAAAEALHRVIADEVCRAAVIDAQRARCREFSHEQTAGAVQELFGAMLEDKA